MASTGVDLDLELEMTGLADESVMVTGSGNGSSFSGFADDDFLEEDDSNRRTFSRNVGNRISGFDVSNVICCDAIRIEH